MRVSISVLFLSVALAACSQSAEETATAEPEVEATAVAAEDAENTPAAKPFSFEDEEKQGEALRTMEYSWPVEVSREPELAAQLDAHRLERLAEQKKEWADQIEACGPNSGPCSNNGYSNAYEVVADLPRFLSLSNDFFLYTGGAHGLYGKGSMVWDREDKQSLDPQELFISQAALDQAVREKACAALNRERAKRRGMPVAQDGEWPNQCIGMDETVLFLGSSNGKTFDRFGLYYGPYTAGPYAEGDFELNFPITQAVLNAVKPEYRNAFSVKQ